MLNLLDWAFQKTLLNMKCLGKADIEVKGVSLPKMGFFIIGQSVFSSAQRNSMCMSAMIELYLCKCLTNFAVPKILCRKM
jgi:hypothetical protein